MARSVAGSIVVFHRGTDIVGVGFLVDRRRILTCAHVVNTALGLPLRSQLDLTNRKLEVEFALVDNHPVRKAVVVRWIPPPADGERADGPGDIAGLELLPTETAPVGASGIRFGTPRFGADVQVFGYPTAPSRPDGGWVPGRLHDRVGSGLFQIDSDRLAAMRAQPGFSGSPVVGSGRVVGMCALASVRDDQYDYYAIPPGWLRRVWPAAVRPAMTVPPPRTRRRLLVGAAASAVLAVVGGVLVPKILDDAVATGDCVPLSVTVSTEKDELLAELAERYNAAGRVFGENACATVRTAGLTSGTAMTALAEDWPAASTDQLPRPQVWLPTSSMWTDLLRVAGRGDLLTAERAPSVTTSVLSIAMPARMAAAIRERHGDVSWAGILELARPGHGWADVGHPEWGAFVLGRDNPHRSTSGLAATVATYFAAAGKQRGITEADLLRGEVAEFVHGIESSVIRYGDEATSFMRTLYDEGRDPAVDRPSISAVVIQEQLAYLYNRGAPTGDPAQLGSAPPAEPLVAVQPKEGTVALDHPFVVLSSADQRQRAAAADFLAFLTEDAQQRRFLDLGFRALDRPERPTELLARTVGVPADTAQTFFELPDPPLIKAMQDAWDNTRRPARVLLLLDVSTSMNYDLDRTDSATTTKLDALKPAAKRGLDLLGDNDQVGIWTFADGVTRRLDLARVGTVRHRLDGIIDGLTTANNTALYEATALAHETMLATLDLERINAIVLLTDGQNHPPDPAGRTALLDRLDAANLETSVRVFTVPYGADADTELLTEIAERTRAQLYNATNPRDIDEVMVAVFSNFGAGTPR